MQAIRIYNFGGPDVMQFESIAEPIPVPNEIIIKVFAASVNPVDAKMREGKYPAVTKTELPYVLGRDVSGEVAAIGEEVSAFLIGDQVFAFLSPEHGGYEEFVVAETNEVSRKPKSLDHIAAAAVPLAGITAWQGLFDHGRLKEGQRVLIHGGAGGVGHFAVQFAKAKGAFVATTVSTVDKNFARQLGADQVVDYKMERFEDLVAPVDLVFDLIGGETQGRSFSVVKPGGSLISTLSQPNRARAAELDIRVGRYTAQPNGAQLEQIGNLIDEGTVIVVVDTVYDFNEAAEAQLALEGRHVRGKIVLRVAS